MAIGQAIWYSRITMNKWLILPVLAAAMAILGAGGQHLASGWLGDGVGVGGVRTGLSRHIDNDEVHPNVPLLLQRIGTLSTQQETLGTRINALDSNMIVVIGLLGEIKGRLPAQ